MEEDVSIPPILKFDGLNKELATKGFLAADFHRDLSQEPKIEEEACVFKTREPEGEILAKTLMDTHEVSLPPIEIASQWVEVGVSKEAVALKEGRKSKAAPSINPVDTPSSNPPPIKPTTVPVIRIGSMNIMKVP